MESCSVTTVQQQKTGVSSNPCPSTTVGSQPLLSAVDGCEVTTLSNPSVCVLAVNELVKGCRVLFLRDDGLLYAGSVNPITPPDLYELLIDGERGSKGHIYCAEEMLTQAVSCWG